MNVPFLDLKAQFKQIEHDVVRMATEAMSSASFIGGPQVTGFEAEFADFCDSRFCVGVGSGTDALRFSLIALDISSGDRVATVPNTFIATTEAISQVGAEPVFIDIDPKTYNIDPAKLEDFIRKESAPAAVIPVHLYGQPADMDPISALAKKYRFKVIEDACQAHGALYKGRKAGSIGDAGCFSFYPGKILGAFGEAGAVVVQSEDAARRIRMIRDHGQAEKYFHDMEGYNGRLDAIQAGVLRIKLKRLAEWNQARRNHAMRYGELLADMDAVTTPVEADGCVSVYHLYVILADRRDELQKFLKGKGIDTGLHYPLPLHLQKAYRRLGYGKGAFPVAENAANRLLSLPMYPELTREQIEFVAQSIREFYE